MKYPFPVLTRLIHTSILVAACMAVFPATSLAQRTREELKEQRRDLKEQNENLENRLERQREKLRDARQENREYRREDRQEDRRDYRNDQDDDSRRRYFYSRPRSSFTLTFGTGYAGRGYYYGPPGMPYYYQAPGVTYYQTRSSVPSRYVVRESVRPGSVDVSVQRALAREGFYNGPLDGDVGPGTRSAIASYQRARGLTVTGNINQSLLRALGI